MRRTPLSLTMTACLMTPILTGLEITPAAAQDDLACKAMNTERLPLETRKSPLDSVTFQVDGQPVKICYGRPSARDRTIFGGLVPYDELWRTGANEPTMIHASTALEIAGIEVAAGTYSLYTVPGTDRWTLIVNRATDQWGHERYYTDEIRAQDVGRTQVDAEETESHIETFTIRAESAGEGARVYLEWERTRVAVPIAPATAASGP